MPRIKHQTVGMPAQVACPNCNYQYSKQQSSIRTSDGYRRKRLCMSEACGKTFTTYEILARDITMMRRLREWLKKDSKIGSEI